MPLYRYRCYKCDFVRDCHNSMTDPLPVYCDRCTATMEKIPAGMPAVNWGMPKPSDGGLHPVVEQLNATYDARRDAFAKKKEEHVKRTESENSAAD